ncbi:MAG: VOC family protein [Burkholderiaceae bacterium]
MSDIRRAGTTAIHSVDHFALGVPDLDEAERFFTAFGLDVRRTDDRLDLYTFGNPHCWGRILPGRPSRKLEYLSFGAYHDDLDALAQRAGQGGYGRIDPHPQGDPDGLWLRGPDGLAVQLRAADKVTPAERSATLGSVTHQNAVGALIAPMRSGAPKVTPRRLSHVLLFTTDVDASLAFYCDVLGLRLSDRSGDAIAFTHGAHASDHHLLAFVKSAGPGLHHTSWTVERIDECGMGMEQMYAAGYTRGWGVGRHVIGSNYFYYAQDPWGGFCEFSADIDFIGESTEWPWGDYPPEDSFYLWGPAVPDYFVANPEAEAAAAA